MVQMQHQRKPCVKDLMRSKCAAGLHKALLLGFVALDLLKVQFHETICTVCPGWSLNRPVTWQVSRALAGLLGTSLIKTQEVGLLLQMGLCNMYDRGNGVLCGHFSPVSKLARDLCLTQGLFDLAEDLSQLPSRDVVRTDSFSWASPPSWWPCSRGLVVVVSPSPGSKWLS